MKKYCILGNCQANALASTLQVCKTFKSTYQFQRVTPIHRISHKEHQKFLTELLPEVDLFIYQPISESFRGGGFGFNAVFERLPPSAVVVSYPSIQFYGYHATARNIAKPSDTAKSRSKDILGLAGTDVFHFSQLMMAFVEGAPADEALDRFQTGYSGDDDFIRWRCADSLKHLDNAEKQFDITARLHDKIASNFRNRQLFWSPRHPKGELLADIALSVLDRISLTPTEDERARMPNRDPLRLPRYPMQAIASETLGFEFEGLTEFRSKTVRLGLEDMVQAYYDLYAAMGRQEVSTHLDAAFPNLSSWKVMREKSIS